jgi:hypothetical protein
MLLDIRSFGTVDSDTEHYSVVVKVRERPEVSTQKKNTDFILRSSII